MSYTSSLDQNGDDMIPTDTTDSTGTSASTNVSSNTISPDCGVKISSDCTQSTGAARKTVNSTKCNQNPSSLDLVQDDSPEHPSSAFAVATAAPQDQVNSSLKLFVELSEQGI